MTKKLSIKPELNKKLKFAGIIILLVIFVAVCAAPAIVMNTIYGYVPVIIVVAIIIISIVTLLVLRKKITLDVSLNDVSCERGGTLDIGMQLVNKSLISCPKGIATMFTSDLFGDTDSEQDLQFAIAAKDKVNFDLGIDLSHIGTYEVGFSKIKVYDMLGLFHFKVPVEGKSKAFVLPKIRNMEDFTVVENVDAETDMDSRTTVVGGFDYTGVREYEPGDPMKQIHWKLSAHTNSYMTKIQESNRHQEFAVVLDFAADANDNREMLMDLYDCLVETALSLTHELKRQDTSYTLLYRSKDGIMERTQNAEKSNHVGLMNSFSVITPNPESDFLDGAQLLKMEGSRQNRCTNVVIVTSRITETLLNEIESVMKSKRCPELFYIIPSEWTAREIEDAAARIRSLDQMNIPYHMISTESNIH